VGQCRKRGLFFDPKLSSQKTLLLRYKKLTPGDFPLLRCPADLGILIFMEDAHVKRFRQEAPRLFRGTAVLAAYAYGSRVSGRPRPESDLDVGYFLVGYRHGQRLSIAEEMGLTDALSLAAGCEVDFRDLTQGTLEWQGRVLETGIRIYSGDLVERVALERELLGRYHDLKDTYARMHEIRLGNFIRMGGKGHGG
jgi:predicted nucleotidyltransferase